MTKTKIIAAVVLVLALEVAVIWAFVLPSANSAPMAGSESAAAAGTAEGHDGTAGTAEVPIGDGFRCTNNRASAGTIHVDFKIVVIVSSDVRISFEDKLKEHEARIREAIIKVMRSSSLDDLNDPNLSTIKRLIREEINKILRQSYVIQVVISDFTTLEQ